MAYFFGPPCIHSVGKINGPTYLLVGVHNVCIYGCYCVYEKMKNVSLVGRVNSRCYRPRPAR